MVGIEQEWVAVCVVTVAGDPLATVNWPVVGTPGDDAVADPGVDNAGSRTRSRSI
jgi:hypothetical protein